MSARDGISFGDGVGASVNMHPAVSDRLVIHGWVGVRCQRGIYVGAHYQGHRTIWEDEGPNIISNAGMTHIIGSAMVSVTQDTTYFVLLMDNSPTVAAGDTLVSHAGWVEFTEYSETNRVAWTGAAGAAGVVSNTASPAVFTVNGANGGFGGIGLSTVNTGTSGTFIGGRALTGGNRVVVSTDVLTCTYTITSSTS